MPKIKFLHMRASNILYIPREPFNAITVAYKDKEKALQAYAHLDEINDIQILRDLEDMFMEWDQLISKAYKEYTQIFFDSRLYAHFGFELRQIAERIRLLEEQQIPNVKLLDQNGPIRKIRWSCFMDIVEKHCFTRNTVSSNRDFEAWLHENLSYYWSKIDLEGVFLGGFYLFPEDSDERENACTLTHKTAIVKLVKLKFPRNLIKWLIEYACATRQESYRWVKNACIWFHRMIHSTQILTLQRTIVYQMNCRHE